MFKLLSPPSPLLSPNSTFQQLDHICLKTSFPNPQTTTTSFSQQSIPIFLKDKDVNSRYNDTPMKISALTFSCTTPPLNGIPCCFLPLQVPRGDPPLLQYSTAAAATTTAAAITIIPRCCYF